MKLKFGDIILFKPTSLTGKLISLVDGSPYSHVGIFLEYKDGIPLIIESHEKRGGVVIIKLEEWGNYDVFRTKLKPRPKKEVLTMLGSGYDYSMLIWIFGSKIRKDDRLNNSPTLLICSELADFVYHYKIGEGKVATPKTFALSNKFKKI